MSDWRDILRVKREQDPLGLRKRRRVKLLVSSVVIGLITFNVYHIKRQIAPGQQQLSLVTESVSRSERGKLIRDILAVTQVIFLTSGTSYTRPADWNNANNSIECFGGGQGGQGNFPASCCLWNAGAGGVGGGYAKSSNLTIAGSTTYAIGAGSSGGPSGPAGGAGTVAAAGGSTTWNSTTVVARGGGSSTTQVGSVVTRLGGNGGSGSGLGGGGGGAAGPNAAGVNGSTPTGCTSGAGGRGDGTFGGTGGAGNAGSGASSAGNPGTNITAVPAGTTAGSGGGGSGSRISSAGQGGLYGGGGGGGGFLSAIPGAAGRNGFIVVTYTPGGAKGFNLAMLGF